MRKLIKHLLTCSGYPISISYFGQYVQLLQPMAGRWHCSGTKHLHMLLVQRANVQYFRIFKASNIFNTVNIWFLKYVEVHEPIPGFFSVKFLLPVMVIGTISRSRYLRFTSLGVQDWNESRWPSENIIIQTTFGRDMPVRPKKTIT